MTRERLPPERRESTCVVLDDRRMEVICGKNAELGGLDPQCFNRSLVAVSEDEGAGSAGKVEIPPALAAVQPCGLPVSCLLLRHSPRGIGRPRCDRMSEPVLHDCSWLYGTATAARAGGRAIVPPKYMRRSSATLPSNSAIWRFARSADLESCVTITMVLP